MNNPQQYKVLDIIRGTTVDGPGFRTSIYLSGCNHNCLGCQNPQSWDPDNGTFMSLEEIMEVVEEEDFNVSISGGDPLFHPMKLEKLVDTLKNNRRNVWIYTGFTWEEIISSTILFSAIRKADVVVDGLFIQSLRDSDLQFRGSSNQRIIDIQKSIASGQIILWEKDN